MNKSIYMGPLRLSTGHRDSQFNPYTGSAHLPLFNDGIAIGGQHGNGGRALGRLADIQSSPLVAQHVYYDYDVLDSSLTWKDPYTLSLNLTDRQTGVGTASPSELLEAYTLSTVHTGRKLFGIPRFLVGGDSRVHYPDPSTYVPISVRLYARWTVSNMASGEVLVGRVVNNGANRVLLGDRVLVLDVGVLVLADAYGAVGTSLSANDMPVYVEGQDEIYVPDPTPTTPPTTQPYLLVNTLSNLILSTLPPTFAPGKDVRTPATQDEILQVLSDMLPVHSLTIQDYQPQNKTLTLRGDDVTDTLRLYELSSAVLPSYYDRDDTNTKNVLASALYMLHDDLQPSLFPYAPAVMMCEPKKITIQDQGNPYTYPPTNLTVLVTEVIVAIPRSISDSTVSYGDTSSVLETPTLTESEASQNTNLRSLLVRGDATLMMATVVPVLVSPGIDPPPPAIAILHSMAPIATNMAPPFTITDTVMWRVVLYGHPDTHLPSFRPVPSTITDYNVCTVQIYPALHFDSPPPTMALHLNRGCKRQFVETHYTISSLVLPRMALYRSIMGGNEERSNSWSPMEATHVEVCVGSTRVANDDEVTCRSQPYRSFGTDSSLVIRSAPSRCAPIPPMLASTHTQDLFIRCKLTQPLTVLPKDVGVLKIEVRDENGYVLDTTPVGALQRAPFCSPRLALSYIHIEGDRTRSELTGL
jgi:hypothetical protein